MNTGFAAVPSLPSPRGQSCHSTYLGCHRQVPVGAPDVTCELRDEGELSLLRRSPWQLHPEHGMHQGLVVSPQLERRPLKKEQKMPDGLETDYQLPVKCGILGLCGVAAMPAEPAAGGHNRHRRPRRWWQGREPLKRSCVKEAQRQREPP